MSQNDEARREDAPQERAEPFEILHAPAAANGGDKIEGSPESLQAQGEGRSSADVEPLGTIDGVEAGAPLELTLAIGDDSTAGADPEGTGQIPIAPQIDSATSAGPQSASDNAAAPGDSAGGQSAQLDLSVRADIRVPPNASTPVRSTSDSYAYELPLPVGPEAAPDDDPASRIFPPQYRYGTRPSGSDSQSGSSAASDIGRPLPRVIVMVTMADARDITHDAMREAAEFIAAKLQQLAKYEVDQGFWRLKCEQSAANYGRNW